MNVLGGPSYQIIGNGVTIPINTGTPDKFGTYWTLDGEWGGWDSPDSRVSMLTKIGNDPMAQGEIPSDLHYRGRSVVGTIYGAATSEANREASRYLLAQALDLTYVSGTFLVDEEVPKQIAVYRSGNNNQGKLTMTDQGLSTLYSQMSNLGGYTPGRSFDDGELTAASNVLVSGGTADFTEDDVGSAVSDTAGAIPAGTYVSEYVSATEVLMTANASTGATGDTVTLAGHPSETIVGLDPGTAVWLVKADIEMYAPDPRKYYVDPETADFSGGSLDIANVGNTPTQNMVLTLTDTGGGDGPIDLYLGGLAMQLVKPTVPAGAPALSDIPSTLVIDFYNKTIQDSDGNNYYYLRNLQTPWLVAPVGTTGLAVLPDTIGGSISYYPSWI